MPETPNRKNDPSLDSDENLDEQLLKKRFPSVPALGGIPEAPRVTAALPPDPSKIKPKDDGSGVSLGQYTQMGVAMTAVTSLIAPPLLLIIAGYYADAKFKTGSTFVLIGAVVGLIVGVMNLLRTMKQLS